MLIHKPMRQATLFWGSLSVLVMSLAFGGNDPQREEDLAAVPPNIHSPVEADVSESQQAPPQLAGGCSLTINRTTVSGCYAVSGVSYATIQAEVDWQNPPTNGYIVVTTAGQSRTIVPGVINIPYPQPDGSTLTLSSTIVAPQVVAFEIPADGVARTITAAFSNSSACANTQNYTAPSGCLPTTCSNGALGGVAFNDYDADGVKDPGETSGVGSVTVSAIACDNTKYTTVTDQYGVYTLAVPANKYPVRVEFGIPSAVYNSATTPYGSSSKTSVQFVSQASCNVNIGLLDVQEYSQTDPKIFVPCYVYGDPLVTGSTSATSDAVVGFPYGVSSTTFTGVEHLAVASQVGTLWGMAYNKYTKKAFMSAVLKRHAGLGPLGLGGIYALDYSNSASPTVSNFLSVTSIGINVGTIPSNSARGLVGDKAQPSADPTSFSLTAKVGIGDIDISNDGDKLWLVNLYDRNLYSINIANYNNNGTLPTSADVKSFTLPTSACTNGTLRPWGLKVYKNKVYIGAICDATTSKASDDLRAIVYSFDGTQFTEVFNFPLTYPKGYPNYNQLPATTRGWFPWTDTFSDLQIAAGNTNLVHPQPIFTDIEFDIDGSMVLGFGDRTGFQGGDLNYSPTPAADGNARYTVNSMAGDILRAYAAGNSFVLENNAKAGPAVGAGANNGQGPGFGEFYNDNWNGDGVNLYIHAENAMGALALKPGSGEVVVTTVDPADDVPFSGGVRYLDNQSGELNGSYVVYHTRGVGGVAMPGTFAKSNGLGDIELNSDLPQYNQIGNRVWLDDDKDGEQDACEKGLSGVAVSLYRSGTLVAQTLTDANGEYYFPNYANPSSVTFTGSQTALVANTAYQLVFGTGGQYTNSTSVLTVSNGKYLLTTANATGGNRNDLNDSDAAVATVAGITAPVISLTTSDNGTTNHSLDAGFYCQTIATGTISITQATCNLNSNTGNSNGRISVSGITNADKAAIVVVGGVVPSYTATTNSTITGGVASFSGLSNPTATSGTAYSIVLFNGPCCSTAITTVLPYTDCSCDLSVNLIPGTCNPANNQYTLTGSISLTNTPASSLTISDGARSSVISVTAGQASASFSLTGLTSNGTTHTVTVSSSGTSCSTTSLTYVAPASCTVAATVGVNSATVCYGSSTTLTATGCNGTVNWSNGTTGNTLITPNLTQTTNYTATCTTVSQTAFAVGTVTVNPKPALSIQASSTFVTAGTPVSLSAVGCVGSVQWSTNETSSIISVTPTNSTQTYSATCTTGPGCLTTASVTVNTLPPAGITVSSATICYGSSATLVASGCSSGTVGWSNGTAGNVLQVASLTATTSYTATCSTPTGSVSSAVGTVTVNPKPVLSIQASSTFVTAGTPVSLSAVGCVGGVQWSTNETSSIISVTPTNSTQTYSATCTTGPGCLTTASVTVNTLPPAGITVSSATICYGSSATLVAAGCENGSISWSDGTTGSTLEVASLTATTSYTATCSTPTGSVSSAVGTVVVAVPVAFTLTGTNPGCTGLIPKTNGMLTVSGLAADITLYRYVISEGSSFTGTSASSQPIPANGLIASNLSAPKTYTVRVYDSLGCYADQSVSLTVDCVCPPSVCVPIIIRKVVR